MTNLTNFSPEESVFDESVVVVSVTFNSTGTPVVTFLSLKGSFVAEAFKVVVVVVVIVSGVVVSVDVVVDVSFVLFSIECPCIRSEINTKENVTLEIPILKFCCKDSN